MADLETPQREDVFKRYDIGFQMAILRLCLTEDAFCTKMIGYFGGDKEAEKDLEKFTFFDVNSLHIIFKTIIAAYKQYAKRPTAAQIAQMILQQDDKIKLDKTDRNERTFVDKAEVQKALEKVMNVDISNVEYFKKEMQFFVRQIKAAIATKKITEMQRKQPEAAVKLMQLHVDEMNRITFEEEDLIDLEDVFDMIEESGDSIAQSIPTGIPGLDIDLQGGLPRETLVTILAGTNVGKSMFCGSLGAQCLYATLPNGENAGYKVLHIPLEGMKNETPLRYMACLSGIEYAKIINNALTAEERAKIRDVVGKFKDRLIINTGFLGFNTPVEILIAKVDEIYKVFKFDMLIIDYGQLLSSQATNEGHRFTMAFVFRALAAAARKYGAVVISPAQATRQGQESQNQKNQFMQRQDTKLPLLRSEDISEAFEIARVSGIIMSLNMTDSEREEKKLRVFLEKQRHGVKGKTYGCITDYSRCNLITKNFYDSYSNVSRIVDSGEEKPGEKEFDLNSAIGKGNSLEDNQQMDKLGMLALNIENLRNSLKKKKDELDEEKELNPFELDDPNSTYSKLKVEYDKLFSQIRDDETEFSKMFTEKYPIVKSEYLIEAQSKLTQLNLKGKKSDEDEILSLQKFIRIFKIGISLDGK